MMALGLGWGRCVGMSAMPWGLCIVMVARSRWTRMVTDGVAMPFEPGVAPNPIVIPVSSPDHMAIVHRYITVCVNIIHYRGVIDRNINVFLFHRLIVMYTSRSTFMYWSEFRFPWS